MVDGAIVVNSYDVVVSGRERDSGKSGSMCVR